MGSTLRMIKEGLLGFWGIATLVLGDAKPGNEDFFRLYETRFDYVDYYDHLGCDGEEGCNAGDIARIFGHSDTLASDKTSLDMVDPAGIYSSLTDHTTVFQNIIKKLVEFTSKTIGWLSISGVWTLLRPAAGRGLVEDLSRTQALATPAQDLAQELIIQLGQNSMTALVWLISGLFDMTTTATNNPIRYLPVQKRLWNKTSGTNHADSYEETGRSSRALDGSVDILAALDGLFGADGTQDFMKDNLFETLGGLLFWTLVWFLP